MITQGAVELENCHPFQLPARQRRPGLLAHCTSNLRNAVHGRPFREAHLAKRDASIGFSPEAAPGHHPRA